MADQYANILWTWLTHQGLKRKLNKAGLFTISLLMAWESLKEQRTHVKPGELIISLTWKWSLQKDIPFSGEYGHNATLKDQQVNLD